VQSDWNETDNTSDAFILNKPTFGNITDKDVGTAVGDIQENGAILGNSETVETDATGKFITAGKNTAYNGNFGTGNTDVARGDASYLKTETYTQTEIDNALATKEATANKGVAGGYAGLDGNAQVPLSQIPANVKSSKVVADIAARDAIASADRFEALRVHVLDASADSTVTSGSAGYILKSGLTNSDWEKTYESESLDIDLSDYLNKTTDTLDDVSAGTTNKHFTETLETKLTNIEENATANSTDATLLARANHTGTQVLSTISDAGLLAGKDTISTADVDNNAITIAKIQQVASKSILGRTSVGLGNIEAIDIATTLKADLNLDSSDVGLGNVDNTSDADKPVSTAQQTALDGKLAIANDLSDVNNQQTALNNVTNVSSAGNEQVLTKDTATGNAIFKSIPSLQALLPTGTVVMSIASSLTGALKFDGVSSYSKSTYSTLYALISSLVGTTFDTVDANNFFLPDPADRVLGIAGAGKTLFSSLGADTIALLEPNIPAHFHQQYTNDNVNDVDNVTSTTSPAWKRSAGVQSVNYETESGVGEAVRGKTSTVGSGTAFSIEQLTFIAAQYLYIYY